MKKSIDKYFGQTKIFTVEDKKKIYSKIDQQNNFSHSRKTRRANKLNIVFAYTLTTLLLIIFGWAGIQKNFSDEAHFNEQNAGHDYQIYPPKSKSNEDINGDSIFAKNHPDKFNIVKKMYYSWNYLNNAQGEVEFGQSKTDFMHVQFYVDLSKKLNLGKRESIKNGKVIEKENILFKNGVLISQLLNKDIFTKRSKKDFPNDSNAYFNKEHVGLYNGTVTNSEWYTEIYNNYTDWSYKIGEKFNMPTYDISGIDKLNRPFTMTLSKETGVLLDFKRYNKQHHLIYFIKVNNMKINKGIPREIFHLNVAGEKEVSWNQYMKKSVGYVERNKQGGIEK